MLLKKITETSGGNGDVDSGTLQGGRGVDLKSGIPEKKMVWVKEVKYGRGRTE